MTSNKEYGKDAVRIKEAKERKRKWKRLILKNKFKF